MANLLKKLIFWLDMIIFFHTEKNQATDFKSEYIIKFVVKNTTRHILKTITLFRNEATGAALKLGRLAHIYITALHMYVSNRV